jgi:hypothetical protein
VRSTGPDCAVQCVANLTKAYLIVFYLVMYSMFHMR